MCDHVTSLSHKGEGQVVGGVLPWQRVNSHFEVKVRNKVQSWRQREGVSLPSLSLSLLPPRFALRLKIA